MLLQLLFDTEVPAQVPASSGSAFAIVAFLSIVLLLIGVVVALVRKMREASSSDWDHAQKIKLTNAWKEVEMLAKQGSSAGRKLAIIEADKLVDTALRQVGFPGETMAERMKVAEYRFSTIRQMWLAHKWRNQLVHEAHFSLSERQANEALRAYHAVLRQMNALL